MVVRVPLAPYVGKEVRVSFTVGDDDPVYGKVIKYVSIVGKPDSEMNHVWIRGEVPPAIKRTEKGRMMQATALVTTYDNKRHGLEYTLTGFHSFKWIQERSFI